MTVTVTGVADLEKTLGNLIAAVSSATAKNSIRRGMAKAMEPMAARARELVPVQSGKLRDSIVVTTKSENKAGKAAYADVMRSGGSKADAVSALRAAQGAAKSVVTVNMGLTKPGVRYGHLVEFGAAAHAIKPRTGKRSRGKVRLAFSTNGQFVTPLEVSHPGAPPQPFIRPAFDQTKDQVMASLKDFIADELIAAAVRAERKAARAAAKAAAT